MASFRAVFYVFCRSADVENREVKDGERCELKGESSICLPFEGEHFYNPHHHPEMPRTLQSLDRRVGHGEDYSRMLYDQAVLRHTTK
jgi:hypothetical protein